MIEIPTLIDTRDRGVIIQDFDVVVREPLSGFDFNIRMSKIFFTHKVEVGVMKYTEFDTYAPDDRTTNRFLAMREYVKICADNAEDIKSDLTQINLSMPGVQLKDGLRIMAMDFLVLKDNFMDLLKKDDKIKKVDKFSSNQRFKPLRKDFETFIKLRNIYTHGRLCMRFPEKDFVISYIEKGSKFRKYGILTMETLKSYNSCYKEINELFTAFKDTR
ncbi:hypothetical protein DYBT9623_04453 [Dyadobacter sp. CECT 9623]|uniref:Apea-like HEPN domain-containing protein n=1 Tax=Dyadobacter linearis TaxID=2823330 RepID=A0ABN7RCH0_9BACT|nr:hypothetical protein [Dyadobacter sp. CECT 9623]CAG5072916.1 hypothetical protein DYBT9623_04453 [Dyadobacter sp. CECT 9623]